MVRVAMVANVLFLTLTLYPFDDHAALQLVKTNSTNSSVLEMNRPYSFSFKGEIHLYALRAVTLEWKMYPACGHFFI